MGKHSHHHHHSHHHKHTHSHKKRSRSRSRSVSKSSSSRESIPKKPVTSSPPKNSSVPKEQITLPQTINKTTNFSEPQILPKKPSKWSDSPLEAEPPVLPQPIVKKIYLPNDPKKNFIGLILGPKGIYQKKLEEETNCKILICGK